MNCPVDQETLQMSERQGVEVDYCPRCRGVWLDRGELDKIIERASAELSEPMDYEPRQDERWGGRYGDDDAYEDERYGEHGRWERDRPRRRRRSFLSDMFDFGGDD
jgi:Zn-finger nucleic acid-binding protein